MALLAAFTVLGTAFFLYLTFRSLAAENSVLVNFEKLSVVKPVNKESRVESAILSMETVNPGNRSSLSTYIDSLILGADARLFRINNNSGIYAVPGILDTTQKNNTNNKK